MYKTKLNNAFNAVKSTAYFLNWYKLYNLLYSLYRYEIKSTWFKNIMNFNFDENILGVFLENSSGTSFLFLFAVTERAKHAIEMLKTFDVASVDG